MDESTQSSSESGPVVEREKGAWPFVTWRVYRCPDESCRVWSSRHHRKGLLVGSVKASEAILKQFGRWLWCPHQLNWWIGTIFAVGALLFATGSALTLSPALAAEFGLDSPEVNAVFFAGSIPFTTAAYLQLFQAANAGEFLAGESSPRRRVLFGWRPTDVGWLSSALQFVGTILFNFNTFDAISPSLNWFQQDLEIWAPDIIGSVLFMTSGYLAFIEVCHAHWAWRPASLSWWVVSANLLGCIAFLASAMTALVLPGRENVDVATMSVTFTLVGAVGFLLGSLLMLPESGTPTMPEEETLAVQKVT